MSNANEILFNAGYHSRDALNPDGSPMYLSDTDWAIANNIQNPLSFRGPGPRARDARGPSMDEIDRFWRAFIGGADADSRWRTASIGEPFAFGDDADMADRLAELVLAGTKTATSSLVWEDDEPVAEVGDLAIVLDGAGRPRCVIETIEVRVLPFDEVDEAMAFDEGEGDRSLASWREEHWAFFGRRCVELQREPSFEMPIAFERFRVAYRAPIRRASADPVLSPLSGDATIRNVAQDQGERPMSSRMRP